MIDHATMRAIQLKKIRAATLPEIMRDVSRYTRVSIKDIKSKRRLREIAEARHVFCFIAYRMKHTLKDIGEYCGDRDHSTVINSREVVNNLLEVDLNFQAKYTTLIDKYRK